MQLANSWKQSGRVSLWRYTEKQRNFDGWHLNVDVAGCTSFLALLEVLAIEGGYRSMDVTAPTSAQLRVPNNRNAAWLAPTELRLVLSPNPEDWSFPLETSPAVLTIGAAWLAPLREGIEGIPRGRGDYSIGDRKVGHSLWFWWSVASSSRRS